MIREEGLVLVGGVDDLHAETPAGQPIHTSTQTDLLSNTNVSTAGLLLWRAVQARHLVALLAQAPNDRFIDGGIHGRRAA